MKTLTLTALLALTACSNAPSTAEPQESGSTSSGGLLGRFATVTCDPYHLADAGFRLEAELDGHSSMGTIHLTKISIRGPERIDRSFAVNYAINDGTLRVHSDDLELRLVIERDTLPPTSDANYFGELAIQIAELRACGLGCGGWSVRLN